MNVRASPVGDAVHTQKQVGRLRVVSWNVGTMTGKAMEIADVLRRRKVDIACVCTGGKMERIESEKYVPWLQKNFIMETRAIEMV